VKFVIQDLIDMEIRSVRVVMVVRALPAFVASSLAKFIQQLRASSWTSQSDRTHANTPHR